MKKNTESLYKLQNINKWCNLQIIKVQEEKREKGAETLFKLTMADNFPILRRKLDIQLMKYIFNPKQIQPRDIMLKLFFKKIKGGAYWK